MMSVTPHALLVHMLQHSTNNKGSAQLLQVRVAAAAVQSAAEMSRWRMRRQSARRGQVGQRQWPSDSAAMLWQVAVWDLGAQHCSVAVVWMMMLQLPQRGRRGRQHLHAAGQTHRLHSSRRLLLLLLLHRVALLGQPSLTLVRQGMVCMWMQRQHSLRHLQTKQATALQWPSTRRAMQRMSRWHACSTRGRQQSGERQTLLPLHRSAVLNALLWLLPWRNRLPPRSPWQRAGTPHFARCMLSSQDCGSNSATG